MKDTTILITGVTSGIGKVTAMELAKAGNHVILLARNKEKALQVQEEIIAACGHSRVNVFIADLSSLQEVRNIAAQINAAYKKIDVLINNAGLILSSQRQESVDGNELTLATNHLGPFLLTALLFPLVKNSDSGRIINLSSDAHKVARPDLTNIQLKEGYSVMKAYANSKLYNLLFTIELDRRIKKAGSHITANAVHPGVVNTGFGKKTDGFFGFIFKKLTFLFTTPEQGAQTTIFLATAPGGGNISGQYFKNKKISSTRHTGEKIEKELWEISEKLTGINFL